MFHKIDKEKWLYIFILLNPIFDLLSSLFNYLGFSYTPSTFLRPIMPFIILICIFATDKRTRKPLIISGLVYIVYALIHLYLYSGIRTGISCGTVMHELQYLSNYTYLIFTLFSFIYVFYNGKNNLESMVLYTSIFYISSIYVAIITNTSLPSYVEGTGYKGWFNTSGAVGSVLVVSLFILIPYLIKKNVKFIYKFLFLFLTIFYLCFLIGSRVGLLGSVLVIGFFVISNIVYYLLHNKKFNIVKYLPIIISSAIVLIVTFILFGSYTLDRRKHLDDITDKNIHIAYDLMDIKKKVDNNQVDKNYMSKAQIRALDSLYNYANKVQMPNVDLRKQQLVYNYYLYQYQNDITLKMFGNGYLANYSSLTLEMEGIALFFNFGILGFILFCVPFLTIFFYGIYIAIKHIKKIDVEYMMYLSGILVSYIISTLAGHVYFNTSVMPAIIIIHVLLIIKIREIKGGEEK